MNVNLETFEKTHGATKSDKDLSGYRLFYDEHLLKPTPYHSGGDYFAKAKDRMDRSFNLIKTKVSAAMVLDIGASPFYLLHKAMAAGASNCHGVYFSNDAHPLASVDYIHSEFGQIGVSRANIEEENLPFDNDSIDVLTACEILEHCEYFPSRVLSEIRRVVKPGGMVLLTVPNVCSIANILKLAAQKNVYMKYRSDPTGRHKHEYTMTQLKALVRYLQMDIVRAGVMPSPTSDKFWLRPIYQALAVIPVLRMYSPCIYVLCRQPDPKPLSDLGSPPAILYDHALSIEE